MRTRGEAASASSRLRGVEVVNAPDDGAPGAEAVAALVLRCFDSDDYRDGRRAFCSCGVGCLAGNMYCQPMMIATESTIATMKFF